MCVLSINLKYTVGVNYADFMLFVYFLFVLGTQRECSEFLVVSSGLKEWNDSTVTQCLTK